MCFLSIIFFVHRFWFYCCWKKYASEHVTSENFGLQLSLLGNSFSISFLISFLLSGTLFLLSFNPEIIISDLKNNSQYSYIASILLKTLSISCLFQIFTNYIVSFFEINLKKYYCDAVLICIAILSFIFFF